jgi:hypothetical protein
MTKQEMPSRSSIRQHGCDGADHGPELKVIET